MLPDHASLLAPAPLPSLPGCVNGLTRQWPPRAAGQPPKQNHEAQEPEEYATRDRQHDSTIPGFCLSRSLGRSLECPTQAGYFAGVLRLTRPCIEAAITFTEHRACRFQFLATY